MIWRLAAALAIGVAITSLGRDVDILHLPGVVILWCLLMVWVTIHATTLPPQYYPVVVFVATALAWSLPAALVLKVLPRLRGPRRAIS
ncbi:MAG TPA: hypothetical protein VEB21_10700 [Terriglobales bacterium]|nr:hypothetical protein [Terriglobales bacterium]